MAKKKVRPRQGERVDFDLPKGFYFSKRYGFTDTFYALYRNGRYIEHWLKIPKLTTIYKELLSKGNPRTDAEEIKQWAQRNGLRVIDMRAFHNREKVHVDFILKKLSREKIEEFIVMFERELQGRDSGEFKI